MVEQKLGRKAVLYSGNLIKEQLGGKVDAFLRGASALARAVRPYSKGAAKAGRSLGSGNNSADGIGPRSAQGFPAFPVRTANSTSIPTTGRRSSLRQSGRHDLCDHRRRRPSACSPVSRRAMA